MFFCISQVSFEGSWDGRCRVMAVPASILGDFLWDNVSPMHPFIIMIRIDGLVRMPIIHFFV